jgi:integrase
MLTDTKVRQQKSAGKISDGGGLFLMVTPSGSKLWRQSYRFGGKQKTLAHGAYPQISLQEARARREAAKTLLREGRDPSAHKHGAKHLLIGITTFKAVAEELLAKHEAEKRSAATLNKQRWLLDFAYELLGDRAIDEIEAPEILAVLRRLEARKRYESAKRLRSLCGMVFRFAIATGRAKRDPAADLRGALISPTVVHRAAITEPKKIGGLLRAIDGYDGHATTKLALQLAALTFVRPGELRHGEWSDVDTDKGVWVIPAARMKMRREHRVPLSSQTVAIIKALHAITGGRRWLFPAAHTSLRPMSENTLNAALRRLGYDKTEMTAHGFRTTASTRLNEMGFSPDAIERQLAHVDGNNVRRAYNAAEYWAERVTMMQSWADYLDELRDSR